MKDVKEKQVVEMAKHVCKHAHEDCERRCPDGDRCTSYSTCKELYNAGYRKQSAVIDDFANKLKEKMNDLSRMEYDCTPYFLVSKSFIDKIVSEMKGGAE